MNHRQLLLAAALTGAIAVTSIQTAAAAEWVKLPKGTCERLVGGSLQPMTKGQ
jgi:hypothetical protein